MPKEQKWTIPTADGHLIYGVTNYAGGEPSDKCIVIVHGLTGHIDEKIHAESARFFPEKGYDLIRFFLYTEEHEGARSIRDATLRGQADDLNTVLTEKAAGYEKLFLAGHSYGGPTIMVAQPRQATALCLWDPTFDVPKMWARENIKREDGRCYVIWGDYAAEIGEPLVAEGTANYNGEACLALVECLNCPTMVIHGGESHYIGDEISYHSAGHPLNERKIVDGADHCFNNGDTCDTLLEYTYDWFERF